MTDTRNISRRWALMAAFAFVALGVMAGGCAREDYYCDATGCFFCDGVGCRPVTPPTRNTCRGDWECTGGQVCTNLGCAVGCRVDGDCARGWVCRGATETTPGLCAAPTENPTRNPGTCTSNAQCGGGTICLNGICTQTTSPACMADGDCTGGRVCVTGRCTAPSDTCQFNNQCGAGRVCVNNTCRSACTNDASCPANQQCVSGICRDRMDGCTTDTQCGAGRRCLNGTCYNSCTPGSADCGPELYCTDDGVCAPDTRPRPFCDATRPCQAGSECVGGLCRVPCDNSDQCARVDVSYRNCGPIPYLSMSRNYCLTDREFRPICTRQADCASGQSCVDGACQ